MTQNSVIVYLNVQLSDILDTEFECRVTYDYYPAQRAYTPRGEYAPTEPPEPALAVNLTIEVNTARPAGIFP